MAIPNFGVASHQQSVKVHLRHTAIFLALSLAELSSSWPAMGWLGKDNPSCESESLARILYPQTCILSSVSRTKNNTNKHYCYKCTELSVVYPDEMKNMKKCIWWNICFLSLSPAVYLAAQQSILLYSNNPSLVLQHSQNILTLGSLHSRNMKD